MSVVTKKLMWKPLFDALQESGLLPDAESTRRVVLDAEVGRPMMVYYEKFGDERIAEFLPSMFRESDDPRDAVVR